MAEDHGRDIAVIQMLFRLVVEQAFGQATARGYRDRRQLHRPGVITHGIDPRHVGVLEFIHHDIAFVVGFYASGCEVEIIGLRLTTNGPDQAIHGLTPAIFQLKRQAAVRIFHYRLRNGVSVQLRPFGVHHFDQGINDQRIEAAQRRMFTHEQVRFGAEAVNHARQLNGNIARAHHGDALRQSR